MRQSPGTSGRIALATFAAAVVACAALALSAHADASDAARRAPRATHVGVPVGDIVLLQLVDETTSPKFVRVHTDATRDTSEFVVPEGRALVITGYDLICDWFIGANLPSTTRFWIRNVTTGDRNVLLHREAESFETVGSSTVGYGVRCATHDTLMTGVVLGPGTALDVDAQRLNSVDAGFNANVYSSYGNYEVTVRGYLTTID